MGLLYLSTKFELDRSIYNGDLSWDRNHWKHRQTDTQTETDTLPIYHIGSSNELMLISCKVLPSQTSNLVPRYNTISNI